MSKNVSNTILESFVTALIETIEQNDIQSWLNQDIILTLIESPQYLVDILSCVEENVFVDWISTLPPQLQKFSEDVQSKNS